MKLTASWERNLSSLSRKKGGKIGTCPAWRACGAKAYAWTSLAFELIRLGLIRGFVSKKKKYFGRDMTNA